MKLDKIILLFLLLVVPGISYFFLTTGANNFIKLKVIGEPVCSNTVEVCLEDSSCCVDYSIDDFSFINQNNDTITKESMTGSIYVANFFFTSCPTICPEMTKNMAYLQGKLSVFPDIRFLSHTVDPFNDTPEKLLSYVDLMKQENIDIDLSNWDFVTGDKDKLYQAAVNYLGHAKKDSTEPGGFSHSGHFVLIDKQGRIRSGIDENGNTVGVYDGTNDKNMKYLINDINVLMAEYKKPLKIDKK